MEKTKRFAIYTTVVLLLCCLAKVYGQESKRLDLKTAVKTALTYNERAASADEMSAAASARVLRARSAFLPTITATGTYTRRPNEVTRTINDQQIVVQSRNALAGNVNVNLTLFDSRSFPIFRQLTLNRQAEVYNAIDSKRRLAFEVCSVYLLTLSTHQVYKAAEERFAYSRQNLDASKARFEAQLVSSNDVTRAELEYATAEKSIVRAQGDMETTRLQLEYLLGIPIEGEIDTPERLLVEAEQPPPPEESSIILARQQRPDLKSLDFSARAQHAYAREPLLRWLPSLAFTGQYRFTNESGLSGQNTNWSVGLTTNWAIFDGFLRIGDYKERKALSRIADLDYQAAFRQVDTEVRTALANLQSQQTSLKRATVARDIARKNASETAELYRQGLTGILQAADANVSLFEAEVDWIRERYLLATAFLNLRTALGQDPMDE